MWFDLNGDERINLRCATQDCGGQPTSRLEAGGVGSNYCPGCRWRIERLERRSSEIDKQIDELEAVFGKVE